ncbi:MAG: M24 family metallopeptidase [Terriglobales bacterium]
MNYARRQAEVRHALAERKLDALVVTHLPNIRYLCGFTGSAAVLVAQPGQWAFFTDGRYSAQARQEVQGARVVVAKGPPLPAVGAWLSKAARSARVGIEAEHMTVAMRTALAASLPRRYRVHETSGLVEWLRMVKEAEEIERIRGAVLAGAKLLDTALQVIEPGVSETVVAAEIEYAARQAGAEGMSFPTIVASGKRSALPHGVASACEIARKGFVVLDFGVILGGYCSDMTRTVHVGRPSGEMRSVYEAVQAAQQAAIDAVRAGVTVGEVDGAARRTLRRAGLAKFFTHSTGHGVGLEIHELPRVARAGNSVLRPGTVITIEPGVYIPGKGGVRIEDMVVVTERGCEVLTPAPKELLTL